MSNATGTTIESESDFHPFGGERVITSPTPSLTNQNYKFTGKERDTESGLDYFGARFYSSTLGRWMSADWSAVPIPVPYADLGNPQTLNLFQYVENNPITGVDPDGHMSQARLWAAGPPSDEFGAFGPTEAEMQTDWISIGMEIGLVQLNSGFFSRNQNPVGQAAKAQTSQAQNNNQTVGNSTEGDLAKTMTHEDGSLSTPKKGDPDVLGDAKEALANAIINNAELKKPEQVATPDRPASAQDAQVMKDAVTNRANGGADPVEGRHYYGTTHNPNVKSRDAGNHLKGEAGRETVYEKFGPFRDSTSRRPTWIVIYNNPGQ